MDTQQAIEAMYGKPNKTEESTTLLGSATSAEREGNLYPNDEDQQVGNPYAQESGSLEDRLYGAATQIQLSSDTDFSLISGGDAEAETNLRANVGWIGATCGADQQALESIVAAANEHLLTGGTGQSQQEVMRDLYSEYGTGLAAKLDDARDLVASFPEVRDWLESTGAGNDPKIIRQIIQIAKSPRAQKRLSTLRRK